MRIENAAGNREYRRMVSYLDECRDVALIRLDTYLGMAHEDALDIHEVVNREDPALEDAVRVDADVFTDPAEAIPITSFRKLFSKSKGLARRRPLPPLGRVRFGGPTL